MLWLYIGLSLIVILVFSIPMLSVQITISAVLSSSQIKTNIQGKAFFGLLRFRKEWTLADLLTKGTETEKEDPLTAENSMITEWKEMYKLMLPFHKIIKRFLKKIKTEQFNWSTMIGLGDAADTGVATGIIWTLKETFISFVRYYLSLQHSPRVSVQANYQQMLFETSVECMMKIKVGNAMLTAYKLAREWQKHKKRFTLPAEKDRRKFNA